MMRGLMKRLLECGVILRLYTMVSAGMYCYTALLNESTQMYAIAHASDFALLTMQALGLFALLGAIDVVVNDLMPCQFVIKRALRQRHIVSMAMAACFCIQMWICVRLGMPDAPLPFYAVYVVLIPLSAFADISKRYCFAPPRIVE